MENNKKFKIGDLVKIKNNGHGFYPYYGIITAIKKKKIRTDTKLDHEYQTYSITWFEPNNKQLIMQYSEYGILDLEKVS